MRVLVAVSLAATVQRMGTPSGSADWMVVVASYTEDPGDVSAKADKTPLKPVAVTQDGRIDSLVEMM